MSWSKFAHLLGFGANASDDDEEKKARRAEKEKQEEQADEDEDKDKDKDKDKEKEFKSKKAEEEQENTSAKEEDEDDQEEESEDVKKGRRAENKRCAAIFASPHAAKNVAMAAQLAFETQLSAKEATGVLATLPQPVAMMSTEIKLDQRMHAVSNPQVGVDAPAVKGSGAMDTAQQMKEVYNQVKGKK